MAIGSYRHRVTVQNKTDVPDGKGGYLEAWTDSDPPWHVAIEPVTPRSLEHVLAATVTAEATHVIRGRWRDDVTTRSRLVFNTRVLSVTGVSTPDERPIDLRVVCVEGIP